MPLPVHLQRPYEALQQWFTARQQVAVAFSGGVDSSLLFYLGSRFLGKAHCRGVFVNSVLIARQQAVFARQFATEHDLNLVEGRHRPFAVAGFTDNGAERCYLCKSAIYQDLSQELGQACLLVDGTNMDDDHASRPGFKALAELAVATPYLHCHIGKQEIRALSKALGLATWDRPSDSCLATRIPRGRPITAELLHTVEATEDALHGLGLTGMRATPVDQTLHLTVKEGDLDKFLVSEVRNNIQKKMRSLGFSKVFLDLSERPGILP